MCVKTSVDRCSGVGMSAGVDRSCQGVTDVSKFPLTDAAVSECLLALIEVVKALPMYPNFR